MIQKKPNPIKLFISYSHKDIALCDTLKKYLKPMSKKGLIEFFHDQKIEPGDDWENCIIEKIEEADIFLFLISADLMSSKYIQEVEVERAIQRHEQNDAKIIPIMLEHYPIEDTLFSQFKGLPTDLEPVRGKKWHSKAEAFTDIVRGIRTAVTSIAKKAEQANKEAHNAAVYLNDYFIYFLDREKQITKYQEHFLQRDSKVQFYLIHGEEAQDPEAFYKRICNQESNYSSRVKYIESINLVPAENQVAARTYFLRELFSKFNIDLDLVPQSEWNLSSLLKSPDITGNKLILVGITLYSFEWEDYIPEMLESWFIKNFCHSYNENGYPNFVFILQLIYSFEPDDIDDEKVTATIKTALRDIPELIFLPKLEMVNRKHIVKWMKKHISDYEDRRYFLEKHFHSHEYTMQEVLKKLKMIVKEYNSKNQI